MKNLPTLILGVILGGLLMSILIPRDLSLDARLFSPETSAAVTGNGVAVAINGSHNRVAASWQPAPEPTPTPRFSGLDTLAVGLFILLSGGFVAGTLFYISRGGA